MTLTSGALQCDGHRYGGGGGAEWIQWGVNRLCNVCILNKVTVTALNAGDCRTSLCTEQFGMVSAFWIVQMKYLYSIFVGG